MLNASAANSQSEKPVSSPVKREVSFELNLPSGDSKHSPRTICRSVSEKVPKPNTEEVKIRSKWARHTTK